MPAGQKIPRTYQSRFSFPRTAWVSLPRGLEAAETRVCLSCTLCLWLCSPFFLLPFEHLPECIHFTNSFHKHEMIRRVHVCLSLFSSRNVEEVGHHSSTAKLHRKELQVDDFFNRGWDVHFLFPTCIGFRAETNVAHTQFGWGGGGHKWVQVYICVERGLAVSTVFIQQILIGRAKQSRRLKKVGKLLHFFLLSDKQSELF